jgi:hypothetical protein
MKSGALGPKSVSWILTSIFCRDLGLITWGRPHAAATNCQRRKVTTLLAASSPTRSCRSHKSFPQGGGLAILLNEEGGIA